MGVCAVSFTVEPMCHHSAKLLRRKIKPMLSEAQYDFGPRA